MSRSWSSCVDEICIQWIVFMKWYHCINLFFEEVLIFVLCTFEILVYVLLFCFTHFFWYCLIWHQWALYYISAVAIVCDHTRWFFYSLNCEWKKAVLFFCWSDLSKQNLFEELNQVLHHLQHNNISPMNFSEGVQ